MSNVIAVKNMFIDCEELESLIITNFTGCSNTLQKCGSMFSKCKNLSYIKCKQAFKNWCIFNKTTISLPEQMREGGSGIWEIVD